MANGFGVGIRFFPYRPTLEPINGGKCCQERLLAILRGTFCDLAFQLIFGKEWLLLLLGYFK